jgi:hypothetical protein
VEKCKLGVPQNKAYIKHVKELFEHTKLHFLCHMSLKSQQTSINSNKEAIFFIMRLRCSDSPYIKYKEIIIIMKETHLQILKLKNILHVPEHKNDVVGRRQSI